jgi:hypothetical protein
LARDYLQALDKSYLSAIELGKFLAELERQQDSGSREEALAYLLRTAELTPEQVIELSQAQPIRATVGLQLLLKRYTRAQQYVASNSGEAKRLASGWAKAAEFVKALITSLPPA